MNVIEVIGKKLYLLVIVPVSVLLKKLNGALFAKYQVSSKVLGEVVSDCTCLKVAFRRFECNFMAVLLIILIKNTLFK